MRFTTFAKTEYGIILAMYIEMNVDKYTNAGAEVRKSRAEGRSSIIRPANPPNPPPRAPLAVKTLVSVRRPSYLALY